MLGKRACMQCNGVTGEVLVSLPVHLEVMSVCLRVCLAFVQNFVAKTIEVWEFLEHLGGGCDVTSG